MAESVFHTNIISLKHPLSNWDKYVLCTRSCVLTLKYAIEIFRTNDRYVEVYRLNVQRSEQFLNLPQSFFKDNDKYILLQNLERIYNFFEEIRIKKFRLDIFLYFDVDKGKFKWYFLNRIQNAVQNAGVWSYGIVCVNDNPRILVNGKVDYESFAHIINDTRLLACMYYSQDLDCLET